jgi:hypothetical protein
VTARTEPLPAGAGDGPAREGGTRPACEGGTRPAREGGTPSVTARTELLPLAGAGDAPAREARKGTDEEGTA